MVTPSPAPEVFSLRQDGATAVVSLQASVFAIVDNLHAKESLLSALESVGSNPDIRSVVLFLPPTGMGPAAYAEFLQYGSESAAADNATAYTQLDTHYAREENALAQVVLTLHQLQRVTIACLRGRLAAPFFGASLACDFRLASADAALAVNDALLGVPPGGAMGYLLPRFVGCGRAVELLWRSQPLLAPEALHLDLVNAVFPEADFETQCIDWARRFAGVPLSVVVGTKALCRPYPEAELAHYLQVETQTMRQAMLAHWAQLHPNPGQRP